MVFWDGVWIRLGIYYMHIYLYVCMYVCMFYVYSLVLHGRRHGVLEVLWVGWAGFNNWDILVGA